MCELFGLSSNLPVTATFSLETFARHGGLEGPHKDGWGLAYYEGRSVRLFKEAASASDSELMRFVAGQGLRSSFIVSHIRKASHGVSTYSNTHPFTREMAGYTHVFAHNGDLDDILEIAGLECRQNRPIGETDSEFAFCVLLERLRDLWVDADEIPPLEARFERVVRFAEVIRPLGPANFIYGDSDALFVHGNIRTQKPSRRREPPGLHLAVRSCAPEAPEISGFEMHDDEQEVVLVASVPLTPETWMPLPEGQVLCLRDGRIVLQS